MHSPSIARHQKRPIMDKFLFGSMLPCARKLKRPASSRSTGLALQGLFLRSKTCQLFVERVFALHERLAFSTPSTHQRSTWRSWCLLHRHPVAAAEQATPRPATTTWTSSDSLLTRATHRFLEGSGWDTQIRIKRRRREVGTRTWKHLAPTYSRSGSVPGIHGCARAAAPHGPTTGSCACPVSAGLKQQGLQSNFGNAIMAEAPMFRRGSSRGVCQRMARPRRMADLAARKVHVPSDLLLDSSLPDLRASGVGHVRHARRTS